MFGKKSCEKCGSKINDRHSYCPSCGTPTKRDNEDWGLLGKRDEERETNPFLGGFLGGINEGIMGKMLSSAMKMLEKEMQKEMKTQKNIQPRTNIRLMINGKEISLNNLQGAPNSQKRFPIQKQREILTKNLPQNKLKNFSKLPKEEPKTEIRRFSDRIVYEINMPDVKKIDNLSIIKLEMSIEIKAVTKDKAYYKVIPINLPIINYQLLKEKLILELSVKN